MHQCEEHYLLCGIDKLAPVFAEVWPSRDDTPTVTEGARKRRKKKTTKKLRLEAALDGTLDDGTTETYAETLGRWIRESKVTAADPHWWVQLHVEHYARAPIARAIYEIQQNNSISCAISSR